MSKTLCAAMLLMAGAGASFAQTASGPSANGGRASTVTPGGRRKAAARAVRQEQSQCAGDGGPLPGDRGSNRHAARAHCRRAISARLCRRNEGHGFCRPGARAQQPARRHRGAAGGELTLGDCVGWGELLKAFLRPYALNPSYNLRVRARPMGHTMLSRIIVVAALLPALFPGP